MLVFLVCFAHLMLSTSVGFASVRRSLDHSRRVGCVQNEFASPHAAEARAAAPPGSDRARRGRRELSVDGAVESILVYVLSRRGVCLPCFVTVDDVILVKTRAMFVFVKNQWGVSSMLCHSALILCD